MKVSQNIKNEIDNTRIPTPIKKTVSWHNLVDVVLVPCRREYKDADLSDVLWYNKQDFAWMKSTQKIASDILNEVES